jgi:hypothetical protein
MALERRPEPQRPSLWTLALPVAGIIVAIVVVMALLNTILWFAKVGIVLVLLVGFGVFIGRMSAKRR